jgi:hypothetical protein
MVTKDTFFNEYNPRFTESKRIPGVVTKTSQLLSLDLLMRSVDPEKIQSVDKPLNFLKMEEIPSTNSFIGVITKI